MAERREAIKNSGPREPFTPSTDRPSPPPSLKNIPHFNAHRDSMRKSSLTGLDRIKEGMREAVKQHKELEAALEQVTQDLTTCEREKSELEALLATEKAKASADQESTRKKLLEEEKKINSRVEDLEKTHGTVVEKLEEKVSKGTEDSRRLQSQIDELKGSLAQKDAEVKTRSRELAQHQRCAGEAARKFATCEKELAEKNDMLLFAQTGADDKQKQHEALVAELRTNIAQGEEAHTTLHSQLEMYKQRMVELTQRLITSHDSNASCDVMVRYLQETAADLQHHVETTLEATDESSTATAQAKDEKDNKIRNMQAATDNIKSQIDLNTTTIFRAMNEIEAAAELAEKLQKANADIATLENDLKLTGGSKSIRTIIGTHTSAYNEKCEENGTLKQQLRDLQSQLDVANQERNQFRVDAENKELSKQTVYNMLLDERGRATKLEEKVQQLEKERDEDLTVPADFDPDAADAEYTRDDSQGAEVQHGVKEPGVATRNSSSQSNINVAPKSVTAKTSTARASSKHDNTRKTSTLGEGEANGDNHKSATTQKTSTARAISKHDNTGKASTLGEGEADGDNHKSAAAQKTTTASATDTNGNKRKASTLGEGETEGNSHQSRAVRKTYTTSSNGKDGNKRKASTLGEGETDGNSHKLRAVKKLSTASSTAKNGNKRKVGALVEGETDRNKHNLRPVKKVKASK